MFYNLSWDWIGFFLLLATVFLIFVGIKGFKIKQKTLGVICILFSIFLLICSYLNFRNDRSRFEAHNADPSAGKKVEQKLDNAKDKTEDKAEDAAEALEEKVEDVKETIEEKAEEAKEAGK